MPYISSFEIISVLVPEPRIFLRIPASAAANLNGIKTLLANSWSTFFINGKPFFNNGTRNLQRNCPDCIYFS